MVVHNRDRLDVFGNLNVLYDPSDQDSKSLDGGVLLEQPEKAFQLSNVTLTNDDSSSESEEIYAFQGRPRRYGSRNRRHETDNVEKDLEKTIQDAVRAQQQPENQKDPNLVEWDGPDDPENPMNWSFWKKVYITALPAIMTLVVAFASSVFSADTIITAEKFHVSEEVMILGVSLYVLGFACGPLVFGPLSELYGRSRPLLIGFLCFAVLNIPVAVAQDLQTIFVCRFLSACFGAAPIAITPGILVDMWQPYPRGIATLLWAITIFCGPTFGPIVGEFVVKNNNMGWRWNIWLTLIMAMAIFLPSLLFLSESFVPLLHQRKAACLRLQTRNWALHSQRDEEPVHYGYLLSTYGIKPWKMLALEPILQAITAYTAVTYGLIYLTFFSFPYAFAEVRGWEEGINALPFISLFIGYLVGFLATWLESRIRFQALLKKNQGRVAPEERLPPMIAGSFILIGGLFWYSWTSSPHITWVPQVISGIPIGCGVYMVFLPGLVYLIDIYRANANSALAANGFVRALTACAFPLFGGPMYRNLGVDWATSVIGFVCVALTPFTIVFYVYGRKIRGWSRYVMDRS